MKKNILLKIIALTAILVIGRCVQVQAFTIVLDPGHGGKSPGAVNGSIIEKDVNLSIARNLKSYLEEYKDVKVILTHNGLSETEELEIYDRAMIARNNKADLLVSIHINSYTDEEKNGAEVYVTNNTSQEKYKEDTTKLGNKILNNLSKLGIKNDGVKTKLIPYDDTDIYSDGTRADYYRNYTLCYERN